MSKRENKLAVELLAICKELELIESKRSEPSISPTQKKELERTSILLREREREIISKIGKEISLSIKESGKELEELSKKIRKFTKKMSKTNSSIKKLSQYL